MRGWARRYARFTLFLLALVVATSMAALVLGPTKLPLALLIGFDTAALVFIATVLRWFGQETPATMRARARHDDLDHHQLLQIGSLVIIVVLVALGSELRETGMFAVLLSVATLLLAWVFGNLLFTVHYAHVFYVPEHKGDSGGLEFPGETVPDHWDFAYFAFVLGMTFQVSDVVITSRRIRRLALIHGLIGFVFNIGVIGISVGIISGLFRPG